MNTAVETIGARERQERLRPDREKLLAVADAVEAIGMPPVSSDLSRVVNAMQQALEICSKTIRKAVGDQS